jgi:hypothetical protein
VRIASLIWLWVLLISPFPTTTSPTKTRCRSQLKLWGFCFDPCLSLFVPDAILLLCAGWFLTLCCG